MRSKAPTKDLEICKRRIKALLEEFNCELEASDAYCWVLLRDRDTNETTGMRER